MKTPCPKAFGALAGEAACTECMPNAQRRDDGAPGCTCVANYFFDGVDPAAQEFLGGEEAEGGDGGKGKCARCPEGALCDDVGADGRPVDPLEKHLNLWSFFSSSCYSGFSDAEDGFFTV